MKKVYGYLVLFLVLSVFLLAVGIVSAETVAEKFFKDIKGSSFNLPNWLEGDNLTILLLGILLWMILYSVVKQSMHDVFGNGTFLTGVVSLIITIIAFIFLKDQPAFLRIVEGNIGALGATILTVFPFIIAIYFTAWVSKSLIIARAIWGVFFLYYMYILIFVIDASGDIGFFVVAIIGSLAMFIFMPLIRDKFWGFAIDAYKEKQRRKQIKRKVNRKLEEEEYDSG